jgi:hypothetical protein
VINTFKKIAASQAFSRLFLPALLVTAAAAAFFWKPLSHAALYPIGNFKYRGFLEIRGADNLKVALPPRPDGEIVDYTYRSKGRSFIIKAYGFQMCTVFEAIDESGNRQHLECLIDHWSENDDALLDYHLGTVVLFFYQHDVDFDGVDELAIGLYGTEKFQPDDYPLNSSIVITYYKLLNNQWTAIRFNDSRDMSSARNGLAVFSESELHASTILGKPTVTISGNTVIIPRNLRDFYYKYVFEIGGIESVGNFR